MAITGLVNQDTENYGDILSTNLALEMGFLQVVETGNVPQLNFNATRPTLVRSGEAVLGGGRQDRIVKRSAIHEGNHGVDVFCIQAGRWTPSDTHWIHTDTPVSLRRAILEGASQQDVWDRVQAMLGRAGVQSSTNALGAVYQALQYDFQWKADKFKIVDGQVGMVVTINGEVAGCEYFGDQMCFSRDWKSILGNSYVPEVQENYEENISMKAVQSGVPQFLGELASGGRAAEVVQYNGEVVYACAV